MKSKKSETYIDLLKMEIELEDDPIEKDLLQKELEVFSELEIKNYEK